jgi:phage-related protein
MDDRIFDKSVEDETLALPPKILAKILHIFELIEMAGARLGEPYTKPLVDGLFEIRAKGLEGIGRSIYCYQKGQKIIILHSFVKKEQKTLKRDLEIALRRKKRDNYLRIIFQMFRTLDKMGVGGCAVVGSQGNQTASRLCPCSKDDRGYFWLVYYYYHQIPLPHLTIICYNL